VLSILIAKPSDRKTASKYGVLTTTGPKRQPDHIGNVHLYLKTTTCTHT